LDKVFTIVNIQYFKTKKHDQNTWSHSCSIYQNSIYKLSSSPVVVDVVDVDDVGVVEVEVDVAERYNCHTLYRVSQEQYKILPPLVTVA
jgi:hypothetical protein